VFHPRRSGICLIAGAGVRTYIGAMEQRVNTPAPTLSIVLVEDNAVFAQAVQQYLSLLGHVRVAGHAINGPQAIAMTLQYQPDVLLLDISLGGMSGFDVARSVVELQWPPRLVFLTMHDQEAYREKARSLGAMGYVLKDRFVQDLPPLLDALLDSKSKSL